MPLAIPIGILANLLLVVAVWSEIPVLGGILLLADLVAAAGALFILGGPRKLGARMVVAGSIAFVPLGLIAVFGARQGPPSAIRSTRSPFDSGRFAPMLGASGKGKHERIPTPGSPDGLGGLGRAVAGHRGAVLVAPGRDAGQHAPLVWHRRPRRAEVLHRRVIDEVRGAAGVEAGVHLDLLAEPGVLAPLLEGEPPVRVQALLQAAPERLDLAVRLPVRPAEHLELALALAPLRLQRRARGVLARGALDPPVERVERRPVARDLVLHPD